LKSKVKCGNSSPELKTQGFSCHQFYKKIRQINHDNKIHQWLEHELHDWQTPFHLDDKTMAILLQKQRKNESNDN